jgi:hypothetical protein
MAATAYPAALLALWAADGLSPPAEDARPQTRSVRFVAPPGVRICSLWADALTRPFVPGCGQERT